MPFQAVNFGRQDVYDVPSSASPTEREHPVAVIAPAIPDVEPRPAPARIPGPDGTNVSNEHSVERASRLKRKSELTAMFQTSNKSQLLMLS